MNKKILGLAVLMSLSLPVTAGESGGRTERITNSDAFQYGLIDGSGQLRDVAGPTASGPARDARDVQETPMPRMRMHQRHHDWYDEDGQRLTPHQYKQRHMGGDN
ncbi:MAG: hypothetical protein LPK85_12180 [Gammaproteobacteria bacterium]|nr:hypothetical protein [Gammaproteobacteria bacterium]